jgi:hypothetical protein
MVKTFFIKHLNAKDMLRRIHTLGLFDYNINWGVDLDDELNSLTFRITYTAGGGAEEHEAKVMADLTEYIQAVDKEKPEK